MIANDIQTKLRAYLDANDWEYDVEVAETRLYIKTGLPVRSRLESLSILIVMDNMDEGFSVFAIAPMGAPQETRNSVMKYITLANYGLRKGNFEMDFSDGEIRYKHYVAVIGNELPNDIIEDSLFLPITLMDKYGDGLCTLIEGVSTPEDEIKKAEG